MNVCPVDDRQAQFLVTVGEVCASAELGRLEVTLALEDGSEVAGVPRTVHGCGDELADTGVQPVVFVDGFPVELEQVVAVRLQSPRQLRSSRLGAGR